MFRRSLALLLALWMSVLASAQSQQAAQRNNPPIPTFKTRVRLVIVDVGVSNNKGESVPALKKENFEVLEDGKPQTIASFEEHRPAPIKPTKLPPMPPKVYTNFPLVQSADAVNVLLLDALNTPLPDQVYVHQSSAQKQAANPLMQLMGRNLPDFSQILFKILVKPSSPQPAADAPRIGSNSDIQGPFTRYGIDLAVAADDLKLEPGADASRVGSIEVMLVAYDAEGKPLNFVVGRSEIRIRTKDYASVQRGGLQIHKEMDIPNGDAFLRTGIYDFKSNNAGTLEVPLAAGGNLAVR